MQHDAVNELFGLAGTFPRPGWVVLDAARDHRFTGELRFETSPPVRVYFDRGRIYLAERVTDPSLGARLVDAGALSAIQLERGSVRVGEVEHLGRLFERVPNLERHTVLVTAELMTEECVGWLAAQRVPEVGWTPYRHHPSGMHQWCRAPGWVDLAPGDPLPAPAPDEAPVSYPPPTTRDRGSAIASVGEHTDAFLDGLIEWDEPSWLDGTELEHELTDPFGDRRAVAEHESRGEAPAAHDSDGEATVRSGASRVDPGEVPVEEGDWVDRLDRDGLPDADPLTSPKSLPRLPVEPVDRFELVWPTGEIDEHFGAVDSVVGNGHDPDADRIGASTRLARPAAEVATDVADVADDESSHHVVNETSEPAREDATSDADADADTSDEVVLAVRRAIASIEVGSLAARQRLVDSNDRFGAAWRGAEPDDTGGVPAPGRVAVRSGRNDWSRRTVTRSVFDEPVIEPAIAEPIQAPERGDHGERRAGALRRLIGSLRR